MKKLLLIMGSIFLTQSITNAQIEETINSSKILRVENDGKFGFVDGEHTIIPIMYYSMTVNISVEMIVGIGENLGLIDNRGSVKVPI